LNEKGDRKHGSLQLIGPIRRAEFDSPVVGLEHQIPEGAEPSLPRGGKRTYFFHPDNSLPMLIIAHNERGQEVEYYRYDRLQPSVKLDDADFDPDKLWDKGKTTPKDR
jgi:hypothetical protein